MNLNYQMLMYYFLLFFVLVPGQFVTLPSPTSSKLHINLAHAAVFVIVWQLTHKKVWELSQPKHA